MDDQSYMPGMGHNGGPVFDPAILSALKARSAELLDAGAAWKELGKIETEEHASKLTDFLAQARTHIKAIEDTRKAAKQPHMDAASAVDSAFNPLKAVLTDLGKDLAKMRDAFAAEKQRKLDEQKRIEREEARRAQEEADRQRREAEEAGDAIALAEAEEAEKAAAKAAKAAEKPARAQIASATGGGRTVSMRDYYSAVIQKPLPAFAFFRDQRPEAYAKIIALLTQLAEAEHRSANGVKEIPGVDFIKSQRAV